MSAGRPKALDLYCGAGGVSVGLERAGFDVTGVDLDPMPHYRGGAFVQADALTYPLDGFDFVWASPPCQAHTSLRSLYPDREYPDLIPETRARLVASGIPYCIENVEGAPLGESGHLIMLCGTMFGLQTPDGRAELRRHRLFETSWPIALRPACQHGHYGGESLTVSGTGMGPGNRGKEAAMRRKRALSISGHAVEVSPSNWGRRKTITVTGHTPIENTGRGRRSTITVVGRKGMAGISDKRKAKGRRRESFSTDDARAAMGIDWMPMKYLSQAIPPAYAEWIGREAIGMLACREAAP